MRTGGQLSGAIRDGLANTPLTTLAAIVREEPEALQQRLMTHGFVARKDLTIHDVAGDNPSEQLELMELVFLP